MKLYVNVYEDGLGAAYQTREGAENQQKSGKNHLLCIDTETGESEILWSKPKRRIWSYEGGCIAEALSPKWYGHGHIYFEEDDNGNLIKLADEEVTRRRELNNKENNNG